MTGTHNTGKTTLCYQLVGRLMRKGLRASLAGEPSRSSRFLAAGMRGYETQLDLMTGAVRNELEASRQSDIVICDRSLIDVLGYTRALGEPASQYEEHLRIAMSEFIQHYIKTYTLIFKTTWMFDMAGSDDPLRIPGPDFQRQVDLGIEEAIDSLNAPVIYLADYASALCQVESEILKLLMTESRSDSVETS